MQSLVVYQPNEGDLDRIIFECAELPPITIAMDFSSQRFHVTPVTFNSVNLKK